MIYVKKHLELLGKRVEDKITGAKGVVASVSFDLYGCVQAIVNPGIGKDGKALDQFWFDVARLKVLSEKRVMEPQAYGFEGATGPAEKPAFCKP